MAKFQIICDAAAAIKPEFLENDSIKVVSMPLIVDGKRYMLDAHHRDLPDAKIYEAIENKKDFVLRNPLYLDLKNVYQRYLRDGLDVLIINSQSDYFGNNKYYNLIRSELLKIYPERKIIIIDSLCLANGINILLEYALEYIQMDLGIEEVSEYLSKLSYRISQHIFLPSKRYLPANSFECFRIHNYRQNFVFRGINGYIEYLYNYFRSKPAIKRILKEIVRNFNSKENVITISCIDSNSKYISYIKKYVKKRLNIDVCIEPISISMVSVLGPDAIGIFYLKKEI